MCPAQRASAVKGIAGGVTGIQLLKGSLLQLPLGISVWDVDSAPQHLLLESLLAVAQRALGMVASRCTCQPEQAFSAHSCIQSEADLATQFRWNQALQQGVQRLNSPPGLRGIFSRQTPHWLCRKPLPFPLGAQHALGTCWLGLCSWQKLSKAPKKRERPPDRNRQGK